IRLEWKTREAGGFSRPKETGPSASRMAADRRRRPDFRRRQCTSGLCRVHVPPRMRTAREGYGHEPWPVQGRGERLLRRFEDERGRQIPLAPERDVRD